jgi:hypothetical protein
MALRQPVTDAEGQESVLGNLLARLGSRIELAASTEQRLLAEARALPLGWPEVDAILPDGGLPRGVVELTAPHALGGITRVAMAAARAALERDERALAAWIDPEATLYGPGLARAGIDLARLLVVRPPRASLPRFAVKVAQSHAFDVVVIDVHPVPDSQEDGKTGRLVGRNACEPFPSSRLPVLSSRRSIRSETLVRKLAIAAEEGGATILLLTDSLVRRSAEWPVALRLELSHPSPADLSLRVAKDRRGRVGLAKTVPFMPGASPPDPRSGLFMPGASPPDPRSGLFRAPSQKAG